METAINGFKSTGIFPFNRNAIPEHLYAPAETTERPMQPQVAAATESDTIPPSTPEADRSGDQPSTFSDLPTSLTGPGVPSTSGCSRIKSPSIFKISPMMLQPPPHEEERIEKKQGNRNRGKTAILTATPSKTEPEQEETVKMKKVKTARKLFEAPTASKVKGKKQKKNQKKKKQEESSSSEDEGDFTEACLFCNELYAECVAGEGWIQCNVCREWAHEECSAYEGEGEFVCDFCDNVTADITLID